ncbi:MAG: OmpH family outer membrane protein [Sphingomonas bacterium]|jgi:Skp family chaperone for outer membrane proteins|nr:OmpH family outer membrane protein [Sphingomonas bacterium]
MTKIFKSALFAATAVASLVAVPAFAADGVLVVDFAQVFQNSAAGKSGTSQLTAKYQGIVTQKQNAFNAAAQSYNSQVEAARKVAKPNTPLPAATQQAVQQAGERAQDARDQLDQTQQEVNQVAAYVRSQIVEKAGPVAEQIRAERKAAVVISKDAALASDPADDITTTLVQRLDASFTTPSIIPPQQGAPAAPSATSGKTPQGR